MNKKYILRLYLAGIAHDSQAMIVMLKEQLTNELGNDYSIEVIDVLEKPNLAEEERILATPTIVRLLPEPVKKIILNLNNNTNLVGLDLIIKD